MTLRQAVQRGVIYKDSVIYYTETMRLITLERAIKSGMIDGNTGRFVICERQESEGIQGSRKGHEIFLI